MPPENIPTQANQTQEKRSFVTILIVISLILFLGVGGIAGYNLFNQKKTEQSQQILPTPTPAKLAETSLPTPTDRQETPTTIPTSVPSQISPTPTFMPTSTPGPVAKPATPTPITKLSPSPTTLPTKVPSASPTQTQEKQLPDAGNPAPTLFSILLGSLLLFSSVIILRETS